MRKLQLSKQLGVQGAAAAKRWLKCGPATRVWPQSAQQWQSAVLALGCAQPIWQLAGRSLRLDIAKKLSAAHCERLCILPCKYLCIRATPGWQGLLAAMLGELHVIDEHGARVQDAPGVGCVVRRRRCRPARPGPQPLASGQTATRSHMKSKVAASGLPDEAPGAQAHPV